MLVGLDMGGPILGLWGAAPSGLSGFVGELGEVDFTGGFSTPGALFGGKGSVSGSTSRSKRAMKASRAALVVSLGEWVA